MSVDKVDKVNKESLLGLIVGTIVTTAEGMWVTLKNAMRPPITEEYPEKRWQPLERFRGVPALLTDPKTGKLKCTACGVCARMCPLGIIEVKSHLGEDKKRVLDEYNLDYSRCMVCNLCVEACAFDSLAMSKKYEHATGDVDELVFNKEKLGEFGYEYLPADSPAAQALKKGAKPSELVAAVAAVAAAAPPPPPPPPASPAPPGGEL